MITGRRRILIVDAGSVLVVVIAVRDVPMLTVQVVDVIAVLHGGVTTVVPVGVVVLFGLGVLGGGMFIDVIIVDVVGVAVVQVVRMSVVFNGGVTAVLPVGMGVVGVGVVGLCAHGVCSISWLGSSWVLLWVGTGSTLWARASLTMCPTCSSASA